MSCTCVPVPLGWRESETAETWPAKFGKVQQTSGSEGEFFFLALPLCVCVYVFYTTYCSPGRALSVRIVLPSLLGRTVPPVAMVAPTVAS